MVLVTALATESFVAVCAMVSVGVKMFLLVGS